MSITSALGLRSDKKVRYGVVGLGGIAQQAFLPGVSDTGNSTIAALCTSDPEKANKVGDHYDVSDRYNYDQFGEMIASGKIDAIYLATPNWRHAEFIVPALKAGIHVLTEKPLEISAEKCREIIEAKKASPAKMMVAYRLHFEPATLSAIKTIREGKLGELVLFSSVFSQMVDPDNHRARNGVLAGPLLDMGPYPINASRYLFGQEPIEVVSAMAIRHPGTGFKDMDDTVSVVLRFPNNKLAQFIVSYFGSSVGSYTVVGTRGSIEMNPGFTYGEAALAQSASIEKSKSHKTFKVTDQFAGELQYFSDCILNNADPEPDLEEGLADLVIIDAIQQAIKTRGPVPIDLAPRIRRIDVDAQLKELSANKPPKLVNASPPARQDV